jgi:PTS system nitrogen regulatory IIA component
MRIAEFLKVEAVIPRLSAETKAEALKELALGLERAWPSISAARYLAVLEEREKIGSTGMEKSVAIPHARVAELPSLVAAFGVSQQGLDFEARDGKPSHFLFALVAPESSAGLHLKALSKISRLFRSDQLKESLLQCRTGSDIFNLISLEDTRA